MIYLEIQVVEILIIDDQSQVFGKFENA
ncbi:MAG: hypothetical protein FD167_6228, partial [bacterium]